jgi:acyl-CoA synthetase (AMP-forming)/AMP-acid ligase II
MGHLDIPWARMLLHDILDYRAREHPEAEFAVQGSRSLSYAAAQALANRIASALAARGLAPGDRLALLSKNSIEYAVWYYACSKCGVVPVPLNYRLAPPEWSYILNDAGAKLIFAQDALAQALGPVRGELTTVKHWLALGADVPGWERFESFVDGGVASSPAHRAAPDDDVYQMYTSGTTGRPKGAVITHRAVVSHLYQASFAFGGAGGERMLVVAPLYHAAGSLATFVTVQAGGSLYIQEDFVPAEVVRALSEERIAMAVLVPAMIQFCLVGVPDVAARRYQALRLIIYGASPIAEQTLTRAIEVFGCDFLQAYGMTETTAAVTYLMPADHRRALAGEPKLLLSAGRPLPATEIRIVGEGGRILPSGEIGEIAARGPQLMRGYWNLAEATAEALRDGWMHTGDAGVLDDEGFLYVQDRTKDMIVSGGENVYPREVEDVLYRHPAVAEAAVIGVPDPKWGEAVKAIVVCKQGLTVGAEELMRFCDGRLAGYKRPRSLDFADVLPRNPSGKVLKRELREKYWTGHTRRVS